MAELWYDRLYENLDLALQNVYGIRQIFRALRGYGANAGSQSFRDLYSELVFLAAENPEKELAGQSREIPLPIAFNDWAANAALRDEMGKSSVAGYCCKVKTRVIFTYDTFISQTLETSPT